MTATDWGKVILLALLIFAIAKAGEAIRKWWKGDDNDDH